MTSYVIQRYLWLFGVWEPHLTDWMRSRIAPGDNQRLMVENSRSQSRVAQTAAPSS
ncbi:hypothetical protein [Streptomyces sp. NPDC052015]|uniref:hypothetical protein n=1 Tax=Streptomyces sp. NPDC052015 TaxID=3154755 RepID=UPI00341630DD